MADASTNARFLYPWVLHHQKLGLQLKCPLCLNLLNRPRLLPCNHIFCDFCVPRSTQFGSECPVCKQEYAEPDVRPAPYIENFVTIYRSFEASFSASLFQPLTSEAEMVSQESRSSLYTNVDCGIKESVETPQEESNNVECPILLPNCKRVWAPFNHSIAEGNKLIGKHDKSTQTMKIMKEEFNMGYVDPVFMHHVDKMISPKFPGWLRGEKHKELGEEELCINQELQSSPVSPSSSDTKGIADNPGSSNDSTGKVPSKRLLENYNKGEGEIARLPADALVVRANNAKRQKKPNNVNIGVPITGCGKPNMCLAISKLECGELSGAKDHTIPDSRGASESICAFCQSSGVGDRSGPILHYANGKEVIGDTATNTSVIHAHQICIEWTPQAYFVGETVKNLKSEVARAAKLKCCSCGLKGAALGCFVKSCRKSYHVPCAIEVLGCRWDLENFLMLCPTHSSVKFPCEKSMPKKHASQEQHFVSTEMITSKQPMLWVASPNGLKEWVLCGSALSAEDKCLLFKFASICGATVSKFWNPNVTHVIAATDADGACSRTLKVLMAILNGKWILKTSWIKACMEAMHPVDEESYEVSIDNHGCCDGPKTGRLRALNNAPKLFNGLNFYFSGDFIPGYKEDLLDLVIAAGGFVIENKAQLFAGSQNAQSTTSPPTLIVYNNDSMQECRLEMKGSTVLQRLETAENLASETGFQVIPHTWLLESIVACKL